MKVHSYQTDTEMNLLFCEAIGISVDLYSLGNPRKDRQRFVDGIILISTPDWLKGLSNFENVVETPFEYGLRMPNNARLCQTV